MSEFRDKCANIALGGSTGGRRHRSAGGPGYIADRGQNRRSAGLSGRYVLGLRGGVRMRQGCRVLDMNRWIEAAVDRALEPGGGAGGEGCDSLRSLVFWEKEGCAL